MSRQDYTQYKTPERIMRPDTKAHTNLKTTTPPTIEPFSRATRQSKNISIEIDYDCRNCNKTHSTEKLHAYRSSQNRSFTEGGDRLSNYESKIQLLKDYVHNADLLERQKIVEIFGFTYQCCSSSVDSSKIVLKQLSSKVQQLIKQNSNLRQSRIYSTVQGKTAEEYELLQAQNRKLKAIIEQYRNNENSTINKLSNQNYRLNKELEGFKMKSSNNVNEDELLLIQNRKLRAMIDEHSDKMNTENSRLRKEIQELQMKLKRVESSTVIKRPLPTDMSQVYSKQDIEVAKKQLTKQMFEFSQSLESKYKHEKQRISNLSNRLAIAQSKISNYEKQRKIHIESTIRKSFALSQSLQRPKGDNDGDHHQIDEEIGTRPVSSFVSIHSVNKVDNTTTLKNEMKMLSDQLKIEEIKNKNLSEQNLALRGYLSQSQQKVNEKIARIIQLEKLLTTQERNNERESKGKEKEKQSKEKETKEVEKVFIITNNKPNQNQPQIPQINNQVRTIRETLQACNVSNYNYFFKEFNQILEQRNQMKMRIDEYMIASSRIKQSRGEGSEVIGNLTKKISSLMQQNQMLIKRNVELEEEVNKYHSEIISHEIEKLSSLQVNYANGPSGRQARQWQEKVKVCIENSLMRLRNLEGRLAQNSRRV